jgi:hypothetical protein
MLAPPCHPVRVLTSPQCNRSATPWPGGHVLGAHRICCSWLLNPGRRVLSTPPVRPATRTCTGPALARPPGVVLEGPRPLALSTRSWRDKGVQKTGTLVLYGDETITLPANKTPLPRAQGLSEFIASWNTALDRIFLKYG